MKRLVICVAGSLQAAIRSLSLGLVYGYRLLISPCLGPRCRFHPSCSAFALQALRQHGNRRALALILKRLARCHPWCDGGYDPVPPSKMQGTAIAKDTKPSPLNSH